MSTTHPTRAEAGKPRVPGQPGFSRYERWFLFLALASICVWGWIGVDWNVIRESDPETPTRWVAGASIDPDRGADGKNVAVGRGQELFVSNGCDACHSIDGSIVIGPDLLGIWGAERTMADGSTVEVDEAYFYESVLEPDARIVEGFDDAMPSYRDLLSSEDLAALADYVRSLS